MTRPRHRFQLWGWIAIAVVCTLFGLLMIAIADEAEQRYGGLALILFMGVGPLGFVGAPLLTRWGPRTVQRERVETSVGSEAAFVFPTPRAKHWRR